MSAPQHRASHDVPYGDLPAAPTLTDTDPRLDRLLDTKPPEPPDFDDFWVDTLRAARARPPRLSGRRVSTPLVTVEIEDVSFPGWGGQPVRAWLVLPARRAGPLPVVVQYCGYGGGRGEALDHLVWASAGFAHLVMDSRGQGGDTPDPGPAPEGPDGPHVIRGVTSPQTYYYRRLITDAVRAVDCVRLDPRLMAEAVVVAGTSQGGGLALAVAALVPDVAMLLCDLPFMSSWRRAMQVADRGPYTEVVRYCANYPQRAAAAMRTLSYAEGTSFAARAVAPASFSVALRDRVCPPSTVLAAFDAYAGPKELTTLPYNDHEGGGTAHLADNVHRVLKALRTPPASAPS